MVKKTLIVGGLILFLGGGLFLFWQLFDQSAPKLISPLVSSRSKPSQYQPYSFENLTKRNFKGGKIKIGEVIGEEEAYTAYFFYFFSEEKRVSGQLSLPLKGQNLPVVILLRGYADKEIYFTGLGTRKAAGFFAENGFLALAPDFLGFGQSDQETDDILLNRFKRPETVLNLLASLENLNQALEEKSLAVRIDPGRVFFWGHSNGGQIALSVLEISQRSIPTVLWAPVSQSFPGSILEYASELEDEGRLVIRAIEEFEKNHDLAQYSIASYFDRIKAPLQIHQGREDQYVSIEDSDELVLILNKLGKNVTYYVYPDDDHNFKKNWDQVAERDLGFFRKYL